MGILKKCSVCLLIKPNYCRNMCASCYSKWWAKNNPKKHRAKLNRYYHNHQCEQAIKKRKYLKNNPEIVKKYIEKYKLSEKGKKQIKESHKKYCEKNKIKRQAKNYVNNLVKKGVLCPAKELNCLHCGNKAKQYHHYLGYSKKKWGKVIPLCILCHRKADGILKFY